MVDITNIDLSAAKKEVLEWGAAAKSYDKIGFMKELAFNMGHEEIKCAIVMLTNLKRTAKRKWIGLSLEKAKEEEKKRIKYSEDPNYDELPPPSLPVSSVSVCVGQGVQLPEPWWRQGRHGTIRKKAQVVGYDAEYIELFNMEASKRNRAAKVGVVDSSYNTVYSATVYHKGGSFKVNKYTKAVNGIEKFDLDKKGVHKEMEVVTRELLVQLSGKLVVTCGGVNDFSCADLDVGEHQLEVFDLQNYYRWFPHDASDSPMSLRDIFFLEFGYDFQGTAMHSAEEDARATVKIFMEGYIRRNLDQPTRDNPWHREYFVDFMHLKDMDAMQKFFCRTDKKFKDFKVCKCTCAHCTSIFKNKY